MNIVAPEVYLYQDKPAMAVYQAIERAGRICYKSEDKTTEESYDTFIRGILKRGHEAVIEHEKVTVKVICDRGVSHEIVRHRIASYCQESTRYVSYKDGINVIEPPLNDVKALEIWRAHMQYSEDAYKALLDLGIKPQLARSVLPNSLKTELMITYNLREWRHFFKLRYTPTAHPQMREIAKLILIAMKQYIPLFFEDFDVSQS